MVVYKQFDVHLEVYNDQHFLFFLFFFSFISGIFAFIGIGQYREIPGSHVGKRRTRDWERTISRDLNSGCNCTTFWRAAQNRFQHQHFLNLKKREEKGFQALFPQSLKNSRSLSVSLFLSLPAEVLSVLQVWKGPGWRCKSLDLPLCLSISTP